MDDLIRRQDAINATWFEPYYADPLNVLTEVRDRLEMLPSVQAEPKWIPCSERLPKLRERVLCQCQANIYEVLKLTVNGWYYDQNHCYMESFVIAWMPLPEPYREEGEVNEEGTDHCTDI